MMEVKSTNQISKELNRTYGSVLHFIHEVQRLAGKHLSKLTLAGVIELDETYPHAGEKGVKQRNPRRRGFLGGVDVVHGKVINLLWLQW